MITKFNTSAAPGAGGTSSSSNSLLWGLVALGVAAFLYYEFAYKPKKEKQESEKGQPS